MKESRYLVTSIGNLKATLIFFSRTRRTRAIFLSQIEYWFWELECIRDSIVRFSERRISWESSGNQILEDLKVKGYHLKKSLLTGYDGIGIPASARKRGTMSAPIDQFNELVDDWVELVRLIGSLLSSKNTPQTAESGGKVADLTRFTHPKPKLPDTTAEENPPQEL